ncbi:hypothetical protein CPB84DRAFT_1742137 [Gymnopilus junonius]|uniref:SET domain-containing protein n=1 Tax=Gymnopilus junonius TaxID=109634 RepID=A0A9P5P2T0_GYMJU|nr:hypothetical protein CPB84DRAFT_1742137 [Gymnopilus junonius]
MEFRDYWRRSWQRWPSNVRWDNWNREDGTNTTWETAETINHSSWSKPEKKRRKHLASESLEIDVFTTTDIHNTETYLRNQAYQEKLEKARSEPEPDPFTEMAKLMAKHQGNIQPTMPNRNPLQGKEIALHNTPEPLPLDPPRAHSTSFNTKGKGKRPVPPSESEASDVSMTSVHRKPSQRPSLTSSAKKRRSRIIRSESSEDHRAILPPTPPSPPIRIGPPIKTPKRTPSIPANNVTAAKRKGLQQAWSSYAAKQAAAPIYFVNDIDDEAIPDLDPSFQYLESTYIYSPAVEKPSDGFLVSCSCDYCIEARNCDCQDGSDMKNPQGVSFFAYTHSGFFAFNVQHGIEVIECNKVRLSFRSSKSGSGSMRNVEPSDVLLRTHCDNRVSQRPRDVPIEIFKTASYGWGVRPTVNVQKGKVLGIYTGLVIPRAEAEAISPELSGYRFDLDGDEAEGIEVGHPLHSVDSRLYGNWTRFINYRPLACNNLPLQPLLLAQPPNISRPTRYTSTGSRSDLSQQIPPQSGLPFIAFVAQEDILARTEFTFDYDPSTVDKLQAIKSEIKKKKNTKQWDIAFDAAIQGAKPCYCGSDQCLYLNVPSTYYYFLTLGFILWNTGLVDERMDILVFLSIYHESPSTFIM